MLPHPLEHGRTVPSTFAGMQNGLILSHSGTHASRECWRLAVLLAKCWRVRSLGTTKKKPIVGVLAHFSLFSHTPSFPQALGCVFGKSPTRQHFARSLALQWI